MTEQQTAAYQRNPKPVLVTVNADAVVRACKAHWPSKERMRPDHQWKWREKMETALLAM